MARISRSAASPPSVRGAAAEAAAVAWLEQRGVRILERNWRCRFGEIDIVARDTGSLVFAEVRQRANPRFGGAAASIDIHKQRKLAAAAQLYLARHPECHWMPCRFDVLLLQDIQALSVEWIRNAFEL